MVAMAETNKEIRPGAERVHLLVCSAYAYTYAIAAYTYAIAASMRWSRFSDILPVVCSCQPGYHQHLVAAEGQGASYETAC